MMQKKLASNVRGLGLKQTIKKDFTRNKVLLFMALPVFLWYIIFCYIPMFGISISFFNYNIAKGFSGSTFVGLKHFEDFLTGFYAWRTIRNTLALSILNMIFGFPMPIIIAILLNEIRCNAFKRTVQSITYLPHFISVVVVCGMLVDFCAKDGLFNDIAAFFGMERVSFLLEPKYFRTIYVGSGIWQGAGWEAIIYLAALTSIDTQLYEAATLDGANRFKSFLHVTLPGLVPTIVIMLILNMGKLMSVGADKVLLLYNESTYETADIVSTLVYRRGLIEGNYGYSTAVGLFNSVVNLIFLTTTNFISNKLTGSGLW